MAKKGTLPVRQTPENFQEKNRAIEAARLQLEKKFGKGTLTPTLAYLEATPTIPYGTLMEYLNSTDLEIPSPLNPES